MKKDDAGNVHVGPADIANIAKVNRLKPDMRKEAKGLKGYREVEKLDANGKGTGRHEYVVPGGAQAYGEIMRPFWRADMERHQNNLASMGLPVCEGRSRIKATRRFVRGEWWRCINGKWVPECQSR